MDVACLNTGDGADAGCLAQTQDQVIDLQIGNDSACLLKQRNGRLKMLCDVRLHIGQKIAFRQCDAQTFKRRGVGQDRRFACHDRVG